MLRNKVQTLQLWIKITFFGCLFILFIFFLFFINPFTPRSFCPQWRFEANRAFFWPPSGYKEPNLSRTSFLGRAPHGLPFQNEIQVFSRFSLDSSWLNRALWWFDRYLPTAQVRWQRGIDKDSEAEDQRGARYLRKTYATLRSAFLYLSPNSFQAGWVEQFKASGVILILDENEA